MSGQTDTCLSWPFTHGHSRAAAVPAITSVKAECGGRAAPGISVSLFISIKESVASLPHLQKRLLRPREVEYLSDTVTIALLSPFSFPVLDQQNLLAVCRCLTPVGRICLLVESSIKES